MFWYLSQSMFALCPEQSLTILNHTFPRGEGAQANARGPGERADEAPDGQSDARRGAWQDALVRPVGTQVSAC